MNKTVNHLGVPPQDLTTATPDGKRMVELPVPLGVGSKDHIPFLEVTRNEQKTLLDGARQDVISKWSQPGFTIGDIKDVAKAHVGQNANERHPLNIFKRVSNDDGTVQMAGAELAPGNDRVNRQFEQALKGTRGDRDAAALAVDTIRNAPGYKPDEAITVTSGKNGLIVSQSQSDASLNLQVPQSGVCDFERTAARLQQTEAAQDLALNAVRQQVAQAQPDAARLPSAWAM